MEVSASFRMQIKKEYSFMKYLNSSEMGKRILKRRKELGFTQDKLAELSDVTTQFVSYVENGQRSVRSENIAKIAAALQVSVDYLLTGERIDKDSSILVEKIKKLSPENYRILTALLNELLKQQEE